MVKRAGILSIQAVQHGKNYGPKVARPKNPEQGYIYSTGPDGLPIVVKVFPDRSTGTQPGIFEQTPEKKAAAFAKMQAALSTRKVFKC